MDNKISFSACRGKSNKMRPYLDSVDTYYSISREQEKPKSKKDYAGIGAIIFTFTVMSIVIGLSIYTAWQVVYGQEVNQTVDKLIEDTKRDNADNVKEQEYRTELIKRIQDSNCTEDFERDQQYPYRLPDLSMEDNKDVKGNEATLGDMEKDDTIDRLQGKAGNLTKHEAYILGYLNVTNLENYFKLCVKEGKIQ
jgi:hypothetical protein